MAYKFGSYKDHTSAFAKKTLFINDDVTLNEILIRAREHKAQHVFLKKEYDLVYSVIIKGLIDEGYLVSYEFLITEYSAVINSLPSAIWNHRLFIPVVIVNVPKLETLSNNLTFKFTDNLKSTYGSWCINCSEIMDSNNFTQWDEYDDYVVEEIAEPVSSGDDKPAKKTYTKHTKLLKSRL